MNVGTTNIDELEDVLHDGVLRRDQDRPEGARSLATHTRLCQTGGDITGTALTHLHVNVSACSVIKGMSNDTQTKVYETYGGLANAKQKL